MPTRPDIVFIITDQQRFDTIHALGHPHMETPNLDRLVHAGTAFDHMYVSSPSCAPSRASLFSGVFPHTNGVMRNDEPWNYTWVGLLANAGYHCVNIGKMHTSPFEASFGFHERHVTENKDRAHPSLPFFLDNWDKALFARGLRKPSRLTYRERADYAQSLGAFTWELPPDMHPDVFVAQSAVHWLARFNGDAPLFLQIGLPGPHPPYDPTQEYLDKYLGKDLPKAIRDYDLDSQPAALRKLRENHQTNDHDAIVHLADPDDTQLHRQRAHYYASVEMIDHQVGEILAALERRGSLENTAIIFTTDHGDCLNDHGHSQKWTMYEQSVRVPAVITCPGRVTEGRRISGLSSLFDLGPTILEFAGIVPPEWMQARSLVPCLSGHDAPLRERIFAEHANDMILEHAQFMTMVRETRWKLVHLLDDDEGQLFDLDADPKERVNLWGDAAHASVRQRLIGEILAWRLRDAVATQGFVRELAAGQYPQR